MTRETNRRALDKSLPSCAATTHSHGESLPSEPESEHLQGAVQRTETSRPCSWGV